MKTVTTLLVFLIFNQTLLAQYGKDGSETISASDVILNRYTTLADNANTGSATITVNTINNLNGTANDPTTNNPYTYNPYTTDALSSGDLLMIIKMQGASINTANDANYGSITNYNNTGAYELFEVQSVSGNTITLKTFLTKTYTVGVTNRVQVIRIPRLSSLTINSAAILTAPAWSSTYTGGVIALEVQGDAIMNGTITADGKGFRGGALDNEYNDPLATAFTDYVYLSAIYGGEKGESIAGYQTDYVVQNGRFGRGAPANGGGGGNTHNSGGGGGANSGGINTWTGTGNPDNTDPTWASAWNLETLAGNFASSTSSGGGRGGYSYSRQNKDALNDKPGSSVWQGDDRKNIGGFGGRPLDYSTAPLFMGGGGGAGDANQSSGSAGANGGGIIYLTVTGNLSGSGNINANGSNAANSTNFHKDALGGGGGGGAIKLNVQGTITNIRLSANGGNGGNQLISNKDSEAEGPGGGGGPGYISVTGNPTIIMNNMGGVNGTTTSGGLEEFPPNGATRGGTPLPVQYITYQPLENIPLPVTFDCFNLKTQSTNRLQITWMAYDEFNVRHYELQESLDKVLWKAAYTQRATPITDPAKEYVISIPLPQTATYYRIKAVDNNGSYQLSCIKYFKPARANDITVTQTASTINIYHKEKITSLKVYNILGQDMKLPLDGGSVLSILNLSELKKGIYILKIKSDNEELTHKFLR